MEECLAKLDVPPEVLESSNTARKSTVMREFLRDQEFSVWCNYPSKGKGIALFDECRASNKWILDRKGLSASEWTNCIKMIPNVAPVRSIPGRSKDGTRCRYCNETETLSHVLGSCQHGMLLRNARHHRIRSLIAAALKNRGMTVFEEVHCTAELGSNRRIDIIAFDQVSRDGYIIDPTIRMEKEKIQPAEVYDEKRQIYEPCVPDLMQKYQLKRIDVIGLLVGARGTITTFFEDFRKKFQLPTTLRNEVVLTTLKGSSQILQHHLYSTLQHQ